MHLYNFLVCGPKFTRFLLANVGGVDVWCRDPFGGCSRSKSKVVRNRAEIWRFFGPPKFYTHFITPASRHVGWKKFCEDTSTSAEVIGAQTLNFKPNFTFSPFNFFRGSPSQLWCALASVGQSVSHVNIWGGSTPQGSKYSLPKNVRLGGSVWAHITLLFVDQSSPNFSYPTWKGL